MRPFALVRPAAIAVGAAAALTLAASAPGCGTDAVGVAACQQIESARCLWASNCGIDLTDPLHHGSPGTDIDACIQFYQTQCLHGLVTSVTPGAVEVNDCVAAINTGNCDYVKNPQDAPACSFLYGDGGAEAGTGCQTLGSCKVFLLSETSGNLGGLAGADALCESAATGLGLTGTFRAWLSDDSGNSPATRFVQNTVPYVSQATGNTIADNYAGLISGSLLNAVGSTATTVWTGTNANGTADVGNTCTGFTLGTGNGEIGGSTQTTSAWTASTAQGCGNSASIMCFQQ